MQRAVYAYVPYVVIASRSLPIHMVRLPQTTTDFIIGRTTMPRETHTITIDHDTGEMSSKALTIFLENLEDYIRYEACDEEDDKAVEACRTLQVHFQGQEDS